ncbi:MAG TPA: Clp protease N-terminal domain-containing protein [Bryobacteraceae bacterium]
MFERYSQRARILIFLALDVARKRGGDYIELEDLLEAIIREDRGEFPSIFAEAIHSGSFATPAAAGFFPETAAQALLSALDTRPRGSQIRSGDMPLSRAVKNALARAAENTGDGKISVIEPLHLLEAIVEDRESRLAQLLRDNSITRQRVAVALGRLPG